MFTRPFRGPCKRYKEKIGPLIFEFSTFGKKDFEHGRDFVTQLDQFLSALRSGWRYAVELRNRGWLVPEYFAMLRSHNVAHVFNNSTRIPSALEQLFSAEVLLPPRLRRNSYRKSTTDTRSSCLPPPRKKNLKVPFIFRRSSNFFV